MMPAFLSSAAMRWVEYPGCSMTNTCPEGSVGVNTAQANHPAVPKTATRMSQRILRIADHRIANRKKFFRNVIQDTTATV